MQKDIFSYLDKAGTQFIRVLWCDNANMIRGKAIHRQRLPAYFHHGVGISAAQQAIPVMYDAPVATTGLGPVGEIRLVPDWETLAILPYAPGHARVMGNMVAAGQPWSYCPRDCLKRAIATAADEGLEIKAAFENEFYLLQSVTSGIVPADETVFAATLSMDLQQGVIDQIAEALIAQNILIEQYYPESGPGQQEISILYADALKAADQQIVFRETVRAIALKHNLNASFLPKIFANHAGSGAHLHLSLWKAEENLLPSQDGELSSIARHFVAGLLHHLPALMALTTPSPNSYRRLQPQSWSGAFCCWGFDNREAAIRVPTNPEPPSPTHLELKTVDATANPYIAMAGVIAAGLDGVRRQLVLPHPIDVDPATLTESERQNHNINRLPINLGEAIAQFQQNQVLQDAFGSNLASAFLAVRQAEWEAMKDWTLEQEVKLLIERY